MCIRSVFFIHEYMTMVTAGWSWKNESKSVCMRGGYGNWNSERCLHVKYVQVGKYVYSKKRLGTLRRNRCENVIKSKSQKGKVLQAATSLIIEIWV